MTNNPTETHRLIVEVNDVTHDHLNKLIEIEQLNKTTIVNRAVQVYAEVMGVIRSGGRVYFLDKDSQTMERVTFR